MIYLHGHIVSFDSYCSWQVRNGFLSGPMVWVFCNCIIIWFHVLRRFKLLVLLNMVLITYLCQTLQQPILVKVSLFIFNVQLLEKIMFFFILLYDHDSCLFVILCFRIKWNLNLLNYLNSKQLR